MLTYARTLAPTAVYTLAHVSKLRGKEKKKKKVSGKLSPVAAAAPRRRRRRWGKKDKLSRKWTGIAACGKGKGRRRRRERKWKCSKWKEGDKKIRNRCVVAAQLN